MSDPDFDKTIRDRIGERTETWRAVKDWATRERHHSERTLATHRLDMVDTEYHRGRRDLAIALLRLTAPPEHPDEAEAGFGGGPTEE